MGSYGTGALASPLVGIGLGILFGFASPHNEDDWFGLEISDSAGLGMLIGCF